MRFLERFKKQKQEKPLWTERDIDLYGDYLEWKEYWRKKHLGIFPNPVPESSLVSPMRPTS